MPNRWKTYALEGLKHDCAFVHVQESMPEAPAAVRERYAQLGLPPADVITLAEEVSVSRYFDAALAEGATAKQAANWVMGDLMAHCKVVFVNGLSNEHAPVYEKSEVVVLLPWAFQQSHLLLCCHGTCVVGALRRQAMLHDPTTITCAAAARCKSDHLTLAPGEQVHL